MKVVSANFGFLSAHDAQLERLGALAERYFKDDPNTCLIKLRQFGRPSRSLPQPGPGFFESVMGLFPIAQSWLP